jgi:hypothetical protein
VGWGANGIVVDEQAALLRLCQDAVRQVRWLLAGYNLG